MKKVESLVRGRGAVAALLVFAAASPAAAKSWDCACRMEVTSTFKWLTFTHEMNVFALTKYSGEDHTTASNKCTEQFLESNSESITIDNLLQIAGTKVLSAQKAKWKREKTSLCKLAGQHPNLVRDTNVDVSCLARESGSTKKQGSPIVVRAGRDKLGSVISCQ